MFDISHKASLQLLGADFSYREDFSENCHFQSFRISWLLSSKSRYYNELLGKQNSLLGAVNPRSRTRRSESFFSNSSKMMTNLLFHEGRRRRRRRRH
jgi:hypothetical protein